MERKYDYIIVYRKFLGIWWNVATVTRYDHDGLKLLHRTRDHYKNILGSEVDFKLTLVWNSESHTFKSL